MYIPIASTLSDGPDVSMITDEDAADYIPNNLPTML